MPLRVVVALSLAGCGARTPLSAPPPARDAGAAVVIVPDAGADAGPAVLPDAGPPVPAERCSRDRDCSVGVCAANDGIPAVDLAALSLRCAPLGAVGPPHTACDDGPGCDHGICLTAGSCVAPCLADDDCAGTEEHCAIVYARTGPESLQPVRACVRRVELAGAATVETETIAGALRALDTDQVPLAPASGDATWVVEGPPDVELYATQLASRDSTPRVVWDVFAFGPGTATQSNPVTYGVWPVVVRVPIGSTPLSSETGWSLGIQASAPGDVRVTRFTRTDAGRLLDLHVFYVGVPDEPAGPRGPRWLASSLDTAERYLAALGIRIGTITQHRVVGALRERYAIIEEDPSTYVYPDLGPMMALSADARGPGLNLFFVRYIDAAQGISGGIPGPPGMHGTTASGVAIAADEILGAPELIGLVVAHEASHYLGLFHTSEADGSVLEPLSDTPECRPFRDLDGDGYVTTAECGTAYGADNLMFWAAEGTAVSAEQGRIVGGALLLR